MTRKLPSSSEELSRVACHSCFLKTSMFNLLKRHPNNAANDPLSAHAACDRIAARIPQDWKDDKPIAHE